MHKKVDYKEIISRYLPILIWAIVIFNLSADPEPYKLLPKKLASPVSSEIRMELDRAEKIGDFLHVFEYAILSFLVSRGFIWKKKTGWALIVATVAVSVLFALSDEIHQLYVPNRAFEVSDLTLDICGVFFGIGMYLFCRLKRIPLVFEQTEKM